jgi:hypothetical protein
VRNKKILLLIITFILTAFSAEIIISANDTLQITDRTFENYSGDFIIKNHGVLIIENCTFKNNTLGSKTNDAIFSNDNIIAPIINYGKIFISNGKFINNYSWNTALTDDLKAQVAAGAIANFGELTLSNTEFENNTYQKGHFTILRNESVTQFSYIGNDSIYNEGNIIIQDIAESQDSILPVRIVFLENPVKNKAEIAINTETPISVSISITDYMSNTVFSTSSRISDSKIFTWNLLNPSGQRVSSGSYSLRVTAIDNNGKSVIKMLMLGVKE